MIDLQAVLDGATVAPEVWELRPDYRVLLLAVDGIPTGLGDAASEAALVDAEAHVADLLADAAVEELPHIAAWRDAYRAFGAKPQRTRNSLEALTRRAASGLPRINRLTDHYNAVSVTHQVPLGGEDLTRYVGPPRLTRAAGDEPFETMAEGANVVEHPEVGEVVWGDEDGVTCRRWNWRQAKRTQLTDDTTAALFILDALDPLTDEQLDAAADDLLARLLALNPGLRTARRTLAVSS